MAEEREDGPGQEGDLFDRWLAHREETTESAPRPRTYGVPRSTPRSTEEPRDTPDAAEPGHTADVAAPPPAPVRRPSPRPAAPPSPRPEPVGLADFEPVEIASVRRRRMAEYVEAARTSLDRSVRGTPEERAAEPEAATEAATEEPPAPEPAADPALSRSSYDDLRAEREAAAPPAPDRLPPDLVFRPRTLARRVSSFLLLLGLVATGIAAWRAHDSRVETDIGLAAILALLTGIIWAVRAGTVPTLVSLHGGHLEVRTQAGRFVFEVTSAHTRLENVGTPGRRGWRLLVHRRGLPPFAITAAMVDPRALLEALRYYRPDL